MSAISVPEVNEAIVTAKCNFFVDTHLWPLKAKLDPEGWLGNFSGRDRELAVHLLNGFMYYSNDLVDQLFISAFRGLSRQAIDRSGAPKDQATAWRSFVDDVVVTFPTGEVESVADSGHLFVRRARDLLGIPEIRIMDPGKALSETVDGRVSRLVFVDDFVGSGQQFVTTWHRSHPSIGRSFADITTSDIAFCYLPLFCTQFALDNALSTFANKVRICPAHILSDEYNALNDPSVFWPASMKSEARDFVYATSMRIGLPDTDGTVTNDWQGFCKLGLGIGFEHQIPDASLPIFYTTQNNWTPLWRRSL